MNAETNIARFNIRLTEENNFSQFKAFLEEHRVKIKNFIKFEPSCVWAFAETEPSVFEELFKVKLANKSEYVPNLNGPGTTINNWKSDKPFTIPEILTQLGVDCVELDQETAFTD